MWTRNYFLILLLEKLASSIQQNISYSLKTKLHDEEKEK